MELQELLSTSGSTGGVVVSWNGEEGELAVNASMQDPTVGYSARLPLGVRPDVTAKISQDSYAELGMMTGPSDPMMSFPSGIVFTPYSVARNLSEQPVSATPTLWWMQSGASHSAQLPQLTLTPHQTVKLDVPALLSSAGLKNFQGSFNLVFNASGPRGALLLASGSVDQSNNYVFEVVPRGVGKSASKGLQYWSTGNGDDTMVTLWNPADEAQDFVFTLFYSGGHYAYPIHLEPRATHSFNVSEVIHAGIPDAEGNVAPAGIQSGSAEIAGSLGENQDILVAIDVGIYNVRKATCGSYFCTQCNGEVVASIADNPFAVAVGGNKQETFHYQYNTGTQYDVTSSSSWSSSNTSIARVSSGLTNGVSAGSATIYATYFGSVPVFSVPCQWNNPPPCPPDYIEPSGSGSGNSTPTITSITPSQGTVGTSVFVTLAGTGFNSSATIQVGAGIVATIGTIKSDGTSITATFAIAPNAAVGAYAVTVSETAADKSNQQSNPVTFTVTPSATITIKFSGQKSQGDLLLFGSSTCNGNPGGPLDCANVTNPGWFWNVEISASVSDDASNWTVTQTIDGARNKGFYTDSKGALHAFDTGVTSVSCPPCDGPLSNHLQQISGQKSIFYLDVPGPFRTLLPGQTVNSTTSVQNFTSKFCSTAFPTACFTQKWYVKIVVGPGPFLDQTNSSAGLGTASTSF